MEKIRLNEVERIKKYKEVKAKHDLIIKELYEYINIQSNFINDLEDKYNNKKENNKIILNTIKDLEENIINTTYEKIKMHKKIASKIGTKIYNLEQKHKINGNLIDESSKDYGVLEVNTIVITNELYK